MLEPQPGETILEIGPGYGHYTPSVAQALGPDGILEIFDSRQTLLDQTLERVHAHRLSNVGAMSGDASQLPYRDEYFDGAYLVACLGEIDDREAAIRELARVLRPGGRLVVGETAADPHRVRPAELLELTKAAGLDQSAREGRVSFFARFNRPTP
jgi:ubiquinone/menaquinone biosynthesis C-methylase UbiE